MIITLMWMLCIKERGTENTAWIKIMFNYCYVIAPKAVTHVLKNFDAVEDRQCKNKLRYTYF